MSRSFTGMQTRTNVFSHMHYLATSQPRDTPADQIRWDYYLVFVKNTKTEQRLMSCRAWCLKPEDPQAVLDAGTLVRYQSPMPSDDYGQSLTRWVYKKFGLLMNGLRSLFPHGCGLL